MIKIYSKPDCPYCDRAKEWLDNNLPKLVEKVIAEELKKLIPKKQLYK